LGGGWSAYINFAPTRSCVIICQLKEEAVVRREVNYSFDDTDQIKDLARQVFAGFEKFFMTFYLFHEIRCFDDENLIYWVGYRICRQPYFTSPLITDTSLRLQHYTITFIQELFKVYIGGRKWISISSIHTGTVTRGRATLAAKMRKVLRRGLARAVIAEVVYFWGDMKWDWSNTVKVIVDRANDLYISIHFDFNPKTGKIYVKMPVNTRYVTYTYELKPYSELEKEIGKDVLKVAKDWREKIAALKAL
jgi:hypothetical protein